MDPNRMDCLLAASRISDIAKRNPELFDVKIRAPEIWKRGAAWACGIVIASIATKLVFGHAHDPIPTIALIFLFCALIYFDPPAITKTHRLKASAGEAGTAETAKTGSVHEHATAAISGGDARKDHP